MKPEPVVIRVVCSVCDQPWDAHGADPKLIDCVRLLKLRLAQGHHYRQPNWGLIGDSIISTTINAANTSGTVRLRTPKES